MHVIREPDGERYTTLWRGRHVYTGARQTAWSIGQELEYGKRCPHCIVKLHPASLVHPTPACPGWRDEHKTDER
jgi:hypothetical protein